MAHAPQCRAQPVNPAVLAGLIKNISIVYREDLDLKNHLAGNQRKLIKVAFDHTQALMDVRSELMPIVQANRANAKRSDAYSLLTSMSSHPSGAATVAVRLLLAFDLPIRRTHAHSPSLIRTHAHAAACILPSQDDRNTACHL